MLFLLVTLETIKGLGHTYVVQTGGVVTFLSDDKHRTGNDTCLGATLSQCLRLIMFSLSLLTVAQYKIVQVRPDCLTQ